MNPELVSAIRSGDLSSAKEAIKTDPNAVHESDERGFSPLVLSTYLEQVEIARLLLEHGAKVNGQDAAGNTALMGVVFKGQESIAELLLEHGADVDKQNNNGTTPLIFAAMYGQLGVAKLLLKKGANPSIRDAENHSAKDYALKQGHQEFIELLEKYE